MTNRLTSVAGMFSNALIFLPQNVSNVSAMQKLLTFFSKNITVFAIFQTRNFNITLAKLVCYVLNNNAQVVQLLLSFTHRITVNSLTEFSHTLRILWSYISSRFTSITLYA